MKITLRLFSKQTFSVSVSRRAEAPQSILYKSETEIFEKKIHPPRKALYYIARWRITTPSLHREKSWISFNSLLIQMKGFVTVSVWKFAKYKFSVLTERKLIKKMTDLEILFSTIILFFNRTNEKDTTISSIKN